MRSTLLIPTLNELDALRVILPQIQEGLVDELLFVDGGSTDGTVDFLRSQGCRVHHQVQRGYGSAMREGVELAQGEIIVEFPADGSSLASAVPELVARVEEGWDLVIASRYLGSARSEDDDRVTALGNWLFTRLVNLLFGTRYTDVLVGFRAYRKSRFLELAMDQRGLSWPCQSSIRFARAGMRVTEVPADEPARIGGVRKMSPLGTGWEVLTLIGREFLASKRGPA